MHNNFDDLIEVNQGCCTKSKVASENGNGLKLTQEKILQKFGLIIV